MTAPAEATPGRSWTWVAGTVLIAMGIGSIALVVLTAASSYGFNILFVPIAAAQLIAGICVVRFGGWARVLGVVVAALGILIGLTFMPSFSGSTSEPGSTWPLLRQVLVVSIVPYVFVIVGLLLGSRHVKRQP